MPKFGDYTASTAPNSGDLLLIKDVVSNSTKKITRSNLLVGTALPNNTVTTAAVTDLSITNAKLAANVAWASWTPTWTVLTIGNATQSCKYQQIGKTVIARIDVTLGNTSSVGTGYPTFTLPVTAASVTVGTNLGDLRALVNGFGFKVSAQWASTTTGILRNYLTNGTYLIEDQFTSGAPQTWGTGSVIAGMFIYEAA